VSVHKLAKYCTEDPFTRIPNTAVNDARLGLKALGLLVFMLSKPNGWTFRERALSSQTGVGRDQVRSAMQRLIDTGYVVRCHEPQADGPPIMVTKVYDRPIQPKVGKPKVGKPDRRETQPISNERVLVTKETPSAAKPRERDILFETLAEVAGHDITRLTSSERGRLNKACKELKAAGADPEQIRAAARTWRVTYPTATLTPTALAAHWSTLNKTVVNRRCYDCDRPLNQHDLELCDTIRRATWDR
jgi:hypothetical protein